MSARRTEKEKREQPLSARMRAAWGLPAADPAATMYDLLHEEEGPASGILQ